MPGPPSSRPSAATGAHTPMAFVRAIALAYERRGLSPGAALRKARIAPSELPHDERRVTALQFERLCAFAMQELDDEAPGWFGRRLPWGSYGMLARASISAPTLGLALARWCRHHGLLTRDLSLALAGDGGSARIGIDEHADLGPLREFALLSLLRNLHGLACWLLDAPLPLQAAHFPFAAPPHADIYPRLFPGPVQFGAPGAALLFDAAYLQLPLRRDATALDRMLRRALPIMVWPYRRDRLLTPRVRQLLQRPGTVQTATALAAELALSPRTLHRQLRAEGSGLQALKDEVRQARARELLLRTEWPIARIAHAAGFQNDKSFSRAFRHWTGSTPEAFRRQGRT